MFGDNKEKDEKFKERIVKAINEYYGKRNKIKSIVIETFFEEGSKLMRSKHEFLGTATEEELEEIRKRTDAIPFAREKKE